MPRRWGDGFGQGAHARAAPTASSGPDYDSAITGYCTPRADNHLSVGQSRGLIVADHNLRGELERSGFLTRGPRVRDRRKAGLNKARKRPQFSEG